MDIFSQLQTIAPPSRLADVGVPSASIAVLDDDRITAGVISVTQQEDPNTIYQACSISKPITGIAVARLVDQGQLEYTSRIVDILPEELLSTLFESSTTASLLSHITIERLLSHTAGLSQGGFEGYSSPSGPSLQTVIAGGSPSNTPRLRIINFPGTFFSYAGGGTILVQLVLEQVMGRPFGQIMNDLVLEPLGMTRSHYTGDWLGPDEKNYASAYHTAVTPCDQSYHRLVEQAAAGLWTTPSDLLKMVRGVQASLRGDPGSLLSVSVTRKMLEPVISVPSWGSSAFMARGFCVDSWSFSHGGSNDPGYRCGVFGAMNGPEGVAVMTNSKQGFMTVCRLMNAITYLKGRWRKVEAGCLPTTSYVPYARAGDDAIAGSAGKEDWLGKWNDEFTVQANDGKLEIAWEGMPYLPLHNAAGVNHDEQTVWTLVVEGLEIALELKTGVTGERSIDVLRWGCSSDNSGSRATFKHQAIRT